MFNGSVLAGLSFPLGRPTGFFFFFFFFAPGTFPIN